jgi:hypothetical protein
MRRLRTVSLGELWADRLGVEDVVGVRGELGARLDSLVTAVSGDVPPAGSAEAAVAYGDLLELAGFLADARGVLGGREVRR